MTVRILRWGAIVTSTATIIAACKQHPPPPPAPPPPDASPAASPSAAVVTDAVATDAGPEGQGASRVNPIRDAGPLPPHFVKVVEVKTTPLISDAERIVASGIPRYRQCYEQGLAETASMQGELTISAKVSPDGEVTFADVTRNRGLSSGVASCATIRTKRLSFGHPQGDVPATMTITLKMALQPK